jgi:DNA-binding HxlR family transcriptional regulator
MTVSKDYTTKKLRLLYACKESKRFTDLIEEVDVSRAWLSEALKDLVEKGLVSKTSDDRYVLTEKGRAFIEEREVMELVREAIRKLGAETVKKNIEELLRKKITKAVSEVDLAEALIKLLRVWANITAYWLECSQPGLSKRISREELKAVAAIESVLRELGRKDQWWRTFRTLVPEADIMEDYYKLGVSAVIGMVDNFANLDSIIESADRELLNIKPVIDLLDTNLRNHILLLLDVIEERKKALEPFTAEKAGRKRCITTNIDKSEILAWFMGQSFP